MSACDVADRTWKLNSGEASGTQWALLIVLIAALSMAVIYGSAKLIVGSATTRFASVESTRHAYASEFNRANGAAWSAHTNALVQCARLSETDRLVCRDAAAGEAVRAKAVARIKYRDSGNAGYYPGTRTNMATAVASPGAIEVEAAAFRVAAATR